MDPVAFAQTAKPGGGMVGTPWPRRVPSGAGVSGGGGVVAGGGGSVAGGGGWVIGMVWPALLGTSNRTSPAGPSNPRLAETSDFGQGCPNGGGKSPPLHRLNRICAVCVAPEGDTSRETAI